MIASLNIALTIFTYSIYAKSSGKATGVVTTTRITHATPAASYSHVADRDWEAGAVEGCEDIAAQLIHGPTGKNFNVRPEGGGEGKGRG
jgi:alkaline phosphatase